MASVPNEAAETAIRRIPVSCFMPFSFRGDWGYYNITAFSKNRRQRRWAAGAIAQTKQRLSGNFRGRYPDVGVRAGVRPLAPLHPDLFTASTEEPKQNPPPTETGLLLSACYSRAADLA